MTCLISCSEAPCNHVIMNRRGVSERTATSRSSRFPRGSKPVPCNCTFSCQTHASPLSECRPNNWLFFGEDDNAYRPCRASINRQREILVDMSSLYFREEVIIQGLFLGAESICHERSSREYIGSTYSSYLHFPRGYRMNNRYAKSVTP